MYLLYATSACSDADCFFFEPTRASAPRHVYFIFSTMWWIYQSTFAPLKRQLRVRSLTSKCKRRRKHKKWNETKWTWRSANSSMKVVCIKAFTTHDKHVRSTKYDPIHWNSCWITNETIKATCIFCFFFRFVWFMRTRFVWAKNPKGDAFWKIDLPNSKHLEEARMLLIHWKMVWNLILNSLKFKTKTCNLNTQYADLSVQSIACCHC